MKFEDLLAIRKKILKIYGDVELETMPCCGSNYIIVHFKCDLGYFRFFLRENELKKPFSLECEKSNCLFDTIKKMTKKGVKK